jgi:hypothetical protein
MLLSFSWLNIANKEKLYEDLRNDYVVVNELDKMDWLVKFKNGWINGCCFNHFYDFK